MPSIGWSFPPNNDGREDGLNDPGIETFRDNPLRSLAREIAQNSLDATDSEAGRPVEIQFSLENWARAKFPDADAFATTLSACERYWRGNESTRRFFGRARELMRARTIRVLKIEDFNTTGLRGPFDDRASDWFKLTKAVGASDKAGGAGGSFGIGKHAPYACSQLRTVLYGTRDKAGRYGFQGVSKLVTHEVRGATTQGTGYYGIRAKNAPITDPHDVERGFRRAAVGTDIYVLGFLQEDDWDEQIAMGLIESFFVSIHEGSLVARVGDISVNMASLPDLIEKYARRTRDWLPGPYFTALTSDGSHLFVEDDFEGLGRVELRALASRDYPKRVAMVRGTGMKIFDRGHFQTPVHFAGVLIARGAELNSLLRSLEPPSHTAWEPNRHDDPPYAKGVLRKLYSWMTERIRTLGGIVEAAELDAEGVSQYLPDDAEDEALPSPEAAAEGTRGAPQREISVEVRSSRPPTSRGAAIVDGSPGEDEQPILEGDEPLGTDAVAESVGADGTGNAGAEGDKSKRGDSNEPGPAMRRIPLRAARVFCTDERTGSYRLICEPDEAGAGYLTIRVVGEVGQEAAPVRAFAIPGSERQIPLRPGVVGPVELRKGVRLVMDVELEGSIRYALAVTAHAR